MGYMDALHSFLLAWKEPITLILFINTYLWVGIGHGRSLRLDPYGVCFDRSHFDDGVRLHNVS